VCSVVLKSLKRDGMVWSPGIFLDGLRTLTNTHARTHTWSSVFLESHKGYRSLMDQTVKQFDLFL